MIQARDRIIECFFDAQKETFRRAAQQLGPAPDDATLKKMIEGSVRLAFRAVKADFDRPSRANLGEVVGYLARKAEGMGTPPDLIEQHRGEIEQMLRELPDV
ncbi:MAG TPA: hypothetical protein VGD87_16470 [Archangium sp.]